MDEILQVKDVTAVPDGQEGGSNRIFSNQYGVHIALFPPPYSYLAVTLQDAGLDP